MSKGSKKLYWTAAGGVLLLTLLLALAVILPRIVDSAWLSKTIKTEIASQVKGEFDFQKAELTILPSLSLTLQQVSFTIPETAQVNLDTIRVYPRLLPLLIGNIELDEIIIDNPDFSLPLPRRTVKRQEEEETLNLTASLETATTKLFAALALIPGLDIGLQQGTLRFFSGDTQVFRVEDIDAEFKIRDQGLSATISSFTALHENKNFFAKVENFKGSMQYSKQSITITVDDLTLSYPQLQLGGIFTFDRTVPHASLVFKSQHIDITTIREVLPAFISDLYGELPLVQEIFNIARGGTLTGANFQVEGKSLSDLAEFKAMLIQAHVKDGQVSVPDLGLDLQGVTGDISIAGGVLEGKNLQAKLGHTSGSGGTLKLGLEQKETTPFLLDLDLNADLAEIPPLMTKLVPNKQVIEYLSHIENLKGTALGRLTMGESLESLSTRVEINKISGQANYKPIPYPITVNGGQGVIDGLKAESFNLQGKVGKSTFTNYSSRMSFEDEPTIDVESGTFQVVLDEIFPWLTSNEKLAQELKNIKNISGIADITVKNIKGSPLQRADLQYELQGVLKNITLTATTLPGALNIKSGQAEIAPDKITLTDLHAALLDSTLTSSGVLQNFINGKTNAQVIITNAEIGAELYTWYTEQIKIPKEYQFKTPLLVSRANVKWTREELLDLQGDFSIKNGPIFSLDIMLDPDELVLRNFSLKNGAEEANIKLDMKKREIGAEFQGSLSKRTIEKILLYKDIDHDAWIKGDIKFHINMDDFASSSATGNIDGGDFIIPLQHDTFIILENYSLSASDKTLTLDSATADFLNKKFFINGAAILNQDRLFMDFDVSTDSIELDKILEALPGKDGQNTDRGEEKVKKFRELALGANINIQAESLLYKGYTWKPFESIITFENSSLGIEVVKANLCNISTPGKVLLHDGKISLDFQMEATDQEFSEVLICLEGGEQQMTGLLDLTASISGQGTKDTLVKSLKGDLQYSAKDGYIYQDAQTAKLLSLLNVTDMFKGKIPDLRVEGFHYDSLIVKGVMENGVLVIDPAKLEAPIMDIVANGTIDLPQKKINLQVLVAPLQTVNKIQNMLPIVKHIFPSSIAAVPVEVSGDFSDIKVRALSMSSLSGRVFDIMMDALSTPVRILEEKK